MLSRNSVARTAQKAVRSQRQPANRRGLAAPASGSFQYETGDAKGVKFASRDLPGPTTHLAIVSKAGTRYETLPGLTLGLRSYAFKVRAWRPRTPTSFSRPFIHPRRLLPPRPVSPHTIADPSVTEHPEALRSPHPARVRTARLRTLHQLLPRKPCCRRQVPQRRPALLCRAPRRGCLADQVRTYVAIDPDTSPVVPLRHTSKTLTDAPPPSHSPRLPRGD